jgi:hypothetical protein
MAARAGLLGGWFATCAVASASQLDAAECTRYLEALDRTASAYGVTDAQSARVDGYPHLRTDRFLASFPPGTLDPRAFRDWLDRLQALDLDGRRIELANLPADARASIAARFGIEGHDPGALSDRVDRCAAVLREAMVDSPDLRAELWERAAVPDSYLGWERVLGLYPLTQIPFALGVGAWQRDTLGVFSKPLDRLPVRGELVHYLPPDAATPASGINAPGTEGWNNNPLRVPQPSPAEATRLLLAHAPILVVDTVSDQDRIGAIELDPARRSMVDTGVPAVYTYASHARWQGVVVIQLNYVIWFPARPRNGAFDLLGGHLDGITWRLTLAPDGTVLVADTIHNCGCYHLFFPVPGLQPVAYGESTEERPFVPQRLPALEPGQRFALRIESGTHYLQKVTAEPRGPGDGQRYQLLPYDGLRSLNVDDGSRASLFGPDGIVPGTERGERFLFWPMGVPDPGAMRQRGHHATAFVGRRHFDDPELIERSFVPVGP